MSTAAADSSAVAAMEPPPPLTKAEKAAWKRALKQLKLKDVGKKVEGIRYCAEDSRFFRQGGGLPLLMAFLTRAKQHEILSQALAMFSRLVSEPTQPCSLNAVYILEEGRSPATPWFGGEYFLAIGGMAVDDDMKLTALRIFTKLVQFTMQLPPDHPNQSELVGNVCTRGDPVVHLATAIGSPNVELQFASLQAVYVIAGGHPDSDAFIQSLHESGAPQKILSFLMHDESRFSLLASRCIEHITRSESGRSSFAQVNALSALATKLQVLASGVAVDGLEPGAVEVICQGLELTALTITRLFVTSSAADSLDQLYDTVGHLAGALSTPLLKDKGQASSALVLLSSLGRLLERHDACRSRVKELMFMPSLVHYLMLDETSGAPGRDATEQQEPADVKGKAAKGGKAAKEPPKKETAPPPVAAAAASTAPADSDAPPVDVHAVAKADAAKLTFLLVRNAAEKLLHVCAMVDGGTDVDGRVFGKPATEGDSWMQYETFHSVFSSSDFTTVLRGVRFAATVARHRENGLRMGVAGATSLLTILADQAKAQDSTDTDTAKRAAFTALVADIAQCLVHLAAASVEVCELCGDDVLSPVNTLVTYMLQHASDGAVDALTPLNYDWGVADSSIMDLRTPPRTNKPQVLCAQALAGLARGVLVFNTGQPKAEETQEKGKQPPGKDKKQKDVALLPGEKVASRVAAFSLQLLQLLATLNDFDLHVEVLRLLQSMPYLTNGRKTLLRQAQEQLVLERVPPPADVSGAIDALRLVPPEGIAVGAAPFAQPWTEPLQAYGRILDPILHVFHRIDSPLPDIFAALRVLQGLLVDEKCPQDEYDFDMFANVAVGNGALVVLACLLDLPRLHVVPSGPDHDEALVQLLDAVIHHLIHWGAKHQAAVLAKLEAYIAEEEDTSDAAAQAVARTKAIATRWTQLLAAPHDFARFGYAGMSCLLVAVELGHDKMAKSLLQVGVAPDVADRGKNSSLMKALAAGHHSIVDALMASGADVNALNERDQSVLKFCLVSASHVQSPTVESAMNTLRCADAVSAGGVVTPRTQQVDVLDASILLDNIAADAAGPDYMQRCLEKGSDSSISDDDGSFPLHWVLSAAHIRITVRGCRVCLRFDSTKVDADVVVNLTSLLLLHHAHVNVCNKRGQTPLHVAILNGHGQAALLLLKHGAHPFMTDGLGCLPLHYLCAGMCGSDTIQVLDAIMALSAKFEVTPTAYTDLRKGKSAAEKILVELDGILDEGLEALVAPRALTTRPSSKADLLVHPSKSGLFPFLYACGAREPELDMAFDSNADTAATRVDVLKHIVHKYGLDITRSSTSHGFNALHYAAKYDVVGSNAPVIGFLLESQVPLNAVHEPKEVDVPKMLKPHTTVTFTSGDSEPSTEEAYISSYCHLHEYHLVTATGRHVSHVPRSALVAPREPLALSGEFALSPLHYAVQHSDNATWQLLHAGADLAPDGSDVPLLTLACAAQRGVDVIEYLAPRLAPRQANVRVELAPTVQGTALHFAVSHGDMHVAKLLLDADDASLKVKRSQDGYTPLHIACALGLADMVVFLASKGAFSTISLGPECPLKLLIDGKRLDIVEGLVEAKYLTEPQLAWIGEHASFVDSNVPDWLRPYLPQSVGATAIEADNETAIEANQDHRELLEEVKGGECDEEGPESLVVEPEVTIR